MVKVSVIVPVYNVEKYLKKCINSIITQTLQDIEIICIDDGSTDRSGEILDDFSQKYHQIKVIHNENAGYGRTINLGLEIAQGEYIGIIESDDFIESSMYEELYAVAKEKNLDFIKSSYWDYSEKGKQWIDRLDICECYTVFSNYENMNKIFTPKSIWSGIYKREFLIDNQIRFLETPGASYQDTSFWFKVCITGKRGYFTKKAYVNYRVDNENSSVNSREKVYYVCDEMRECERYLWESDLNIRLIYPFFIFFKQTVYIWNLERILPKFRKSYIDRISAEFKRDMTHSFMSMDGFDEQWITNLIFLTKFPTSYCKYLNEDFIKIRIYNVQDLSNLIEKEEIYLYGAGKIGRKLERYIKNQKSDYVIRYIVSDKKAAVFDNIFDIESQQLDLEKSIVIAVTSVSMKQEMSIRAIDRGFKKIVYLENNVNEFLKNSEMIYGK